MSLAVRSGSWSLTVAPTPDGGLDVVEAQTPEGTAVATGARDVRLTPLGGGAYLLVADGRPRVVTVEPGDDPRGRRVTLGGTTVPVEVRSAADLLMERFGMAADTASAGAEVKAPMPGLVLRVLVAPGERVHAGQGLVVLEAMKMENELAAPADGVVASVHAAEGDAVAKNARLVTLAPPDDAPAGA